MYRTCFNNLGVSPFKGEYIHTDVLYYLISCILKNKRILPKDLSKDTGLHLKKCQRYIYDKLTNNTSSVNLEDINTILNYINYSYSELFKNIDIFIKHKYYVAIFYNNEFTMHSNTYYSMYTKQEVEKLLRIRINMIRTYKLPEHRLEIDKELSLFPASLVMQVKNSFIKKKVA